MPIFVRKFAQQFFPLALRKTIWLRGDARSGVLRNRQFWLMEYYCTNPRCDCRRVNLEVYSDFEMYASIQFGWESLDFYLERSEGDWETSLCLKNGALDTIHPGGRWADIVLDLVRRKVLRNPKYVAQFREHYRMLRRALREAESSVSFSWKPKVLRRRRF